jgi:hypothetical protein
MTDLNKPVRRRCALPHRGRRIVVSLEPGDLLGFRLERTRRTEYLPVAACYDAAVKARVYQERRAKIEAKRKGKV